MTDINPKGSKQDANAKMTAKERSWYAVKDYLTPSELKANPGIIIEIANAIREAEKEAEKRVLTNGSYRKEAYAKGYEDAVERAAKLVEETHKFCDLPMCEIANNIRAFHPK